MKKEYCLNARTGTLHKTGMCRYSREGFTEIKYFETEDEAISSETKYMKHCKICFKEERKINK